MPPGASGRVDEYAEWCSSGHARPTQHRRGTSAAGPGRGASRPAARHEHEHGPTAGPGHSPIAHTDSRARHLSAAGMGVCAPRQLPIGPHHRTASRVVSA